MTALLVMFLAAEFWLVDVCWRIHRETRAALDDIAFVEQCYWLDAVRSVTA